MDAVITLREHAEAIREIAQAPICNPYLVDSRARAILAILDESEILGPENRPDSWCRLVDDPGSSS